mgnify:CR=1 FL=1
MRDKPVKVINTAGLAWASRFLTEDAAWARILNLTGRSRDTSENRAALIRAGWRVVTVETIPETAIEGM